MSMMLDQMNQEPGGRRFSGDRIPELFDLGDRLARADILPSS